MENLPPEQESQMRNRVREMEQTQVNAWLQKMNEELNQPPPCRQQIARQAKEIEQMMNRLEDQYQGMETAMGGGN